ncbi:unnamed protein product [Caenorhabditis auriculariae]|uniref:Uncharacterized protein n=1 Tax=Caenorhabditis auriculariae TaxID=2777116 RepID=A0A8S1HND9_9PELO|nr:unnamed protein product [Caenorhabditis auriculariae]
MKDDRSSKEKGSIDQIKAIELNKSANVIAIDLELTGLGFSQDFRDKDINRRYSNLRTTASTRSIISLGVATYKFLDRNLDKRVFEI